jgi:protein-S-isoprenylcysteine O-methyltransferase Ste14
MAPVNALQLLTIPWLVSEMLVFRRDAQPGGGERRDRFSRLGLFACIGGGVGLAFQSAAIRWWALPGSAWLWLALGAALMLGGILVRARAVAQLGTYFRTEVTLLDDHRLVTEGLYARIRHPAYTGALLTCAGVGLGTGSLVGLAAMILLPGLAFAWRIRVEERALAERFGGAWTEHRARTAALIPGIW